MCEYGLSLVSGMSVLAVDLLADPSRKNEKCTLPQCKKKWLMEPRLFSLRDKYNIYISVGKNNNVVIYRVLSCYMTRHGSVT